MSGMLVKNLLSQSRKISTPQISRVAFTSKSNIRSGAYGKEEHGHHDEHEHHDHPVIIINN
jgi:hypothetical protein